MENAATRIAALSVLLALGGCSGTPTPAQVSTAPAPATTKPSSPSASAPTSVPAEGQTFQVAKLGIQMMVPADFVVVDVTKAKDSSADAYWDEIATKSGMKAATLKAVAGVRAGMAVGPKQAMIAVSASPLKTMPSVADIEKDLKDKKVLSGGTVEAAETGLGEGVVANIQAGTTFQKAVYAQGPSTVVIVNFSGPNASTPGDLFDQVAPTFEAL